MIATEVGFPGDAFRWGFDTESGEGNDEVCVPAFGFRIDAGFAGPIAVPGGIVFAVARIHHIGDAAVEGVVLARGVGTLGEAVEERLGGIRCEIEVDGFLIREDAVAVEGDEGGFIAEFGLGADVEGFVVVEQTRRRSVVLRGSVCNGGRSVSSCAAAFCHSGASSVSFAVVFAMARFLRPMGGALRMAFVSQLKQVFAYGSW